MVFDAIAFEVALQILFQPITLVMLVVGVVIGIVIGVLPGLGPPVALSLALPFTFDMPFVPSIVLLLSIYSASIYGGSISAIVAKIPGTGAAVATAQDGNAMFRAGRGGEALGLSLTGSVIGGLFSAIILAIFAPLLANLAAQFGPREYLAVCVFGLAVVVRVAGASLWKGLAMAGVGLWLTTWGIDPLSGGERYTFGTYQFYSGIKLIPFLIGIFAVSEVFIGAERALKKIEFDAHSLKIQIPGLKRLKELRGTITRSSVVGTIIGIIPGEGAAVAAYYAYAEEKRRSANPEEFGKGTPVGVLAPETANNATVGGALLPTMTLGVPGTPAAAILLGAFAINNLTPGPKLFEERGEIMYAIYIGLFLINIVMMVIGYFAIRFAAQIIRVPQNIVLPIVLLLSVAGIYSTFASLFAVGIMLAAGVFGYIIRKLGFSVAPLVIGFVLGVIFEDGFRQSITTSQGSVLEFFNTPIGLTIYGLLFLTLCGAPMWRRLKKMMKRGV